MLTTQFENLKSIDDLANEAIDALGVSDIGGLGTHEFKLFVFKI